jgi:hypothetical protein
LWQAKSLWHYLLLLLLLLPCTSVVKSSAHAPLDMLGSLLCTPLSSECFGPKQRFIPGIGQKKMQRSLICLLGCV